MSASAPGPTEDTAALIQNTLTQKQKGTVWPSDVGAMT